MRLEKICEKMHFNEIGKPGTVVECIIGNKYVSPPLFDGTLYEVTDIEDGLLNITGYAKQGFCSERFKKANI